MAGRLYRHTAQSGTKNRHFVARLWGARKARTRGQDRIATDVDSSGRGAQLEPPGYPGCSLERRGLGGGRTMRAAVGSNPSRSLRLACCSRSPQNPQNQGETGKGEQESRERGEKTSATTPVTAVP